MHLALLTAGFTLLACTTDPADDTGAPADGTPGTTDPLVVVVTTGRTLASASPAPGITLALDDGAGVRSELQSDASGLVTFQVDWSLGTVNLTVDKGTHLHSLLGVGPEDGPLEVFIPDPTDELERVIVWGEVSPRTPDAVLNVAAFGNSMTYDEPETGYYYLDVVVGEPLVLLAVEFDEEVAGSAYFRQNHSWKVVDVGQLTETRQVDIDLGEQTPAVAAAGFVHLPEISTIRAEAANVLLSIDSGTTFNAWPHGFTTWSERSTTGFDFTTEHVLVPGKTQLFTQISVYTLGGQSSSQWREPGSPDQWTEPVTVLPLPTLSLPDAGWRADRVLALESLDLDSLADVDVQRCVQAHGADGAALWLACDLAADAVRFPLPPSTRSDDPIEQVVVGRPYYVATQGFDLSSPDFRGWSGGPTVDLSGD